MNILDYFKEKTKERKKENDKLLLEYTEEELLQLGALNNNFTILAIIGLIFFWTGIGLIFLFIISIYYTNKIQEIRSKVYRRVLKKGVDEE